MPNEAASEPVENEFTEGLVDETPVAEVEDPEIPEDSWFPAEKEEAAEVVAEKAPEKKAVEEKPADVVAEKKPATLIRTAKSLGLSEAKIASLSQDALDLLCDSLLEQREAEAAAKAKAEPEAEVEDEELAALRELKEELDPKVYKLIEAATLRTKAVEAERKAEKQAAEQKRYTEMVNEVDAAFAELDSPLLGGSAVFAQLDQNGEEMERRNLCIRMALEKPIPGLKLGQMVKAYAKKILGVAASEKPAPDPLAEKKAKWRAAGTTPPATRKETREPGDEAALEAVGKWMKENRINED